MNQKTTAFVLMEVTVLASVIFWFGLIRAYAANHPDSVNADALVKLTG